MNKQTLLTHLNIKDWYISELPSLKVYNGKGQALCPLHNDHKPSLSINFKTGKYYCHSCKKGGDIFSFYQRKHNVGFKTALFELSKFAGLNPEPEKRIDRTYDYLDEKSNRVFQAIRYEPKSFSLRRPNNNRGWINDLQGVKLIPYNLPEVVKAEDVIIAEGEKDVETLRKIGLVASCNPMGAGKWRDEYNQYFKNKNTAIISDNDPIGKEHALKVAKSLNKIAKSVKIIELPNLPEKGDVSDWIAQGHTKEELIKIIKQTTKWEESKEKDFCSSLPRGRDLINLDINLEWVVDKIIPKKAITVLHGKGGVGKTWISLILANCVSKGIPFMGLETEKMPVVYVDLENPLPVLVERARKTGVEDVIFWHSTNNRRPPKLNKPDWELYKSLYKNSLIIFDTLRALQDIDENNSQDMALIMGRLKELREEGFTIILLHHTPKSDERIYKGSTAITDLADHTLSLHKVRKGRVEEIADDEDFDCCYWFGTRPDGKTRYKPFHIFLDLDPEKGFVIAPDPDEENLREIHDLITELKDSIGELPIQSKILDEAKNKLSLNNTKTRNLLKKGEGKYWTSTYFPERKNAKVYEPISVCEFVDPIYRSQTNKLPFQANQFVEDSSPQNTFKNLDNIEFASLLEGIPQTEKLDDIFNHLYKKALARLEIDVDLDKLEKHYPKIKEAENRLNEVWKAGREGKATIEEFKEALDNWEDLMMKSMVNLVN
ncbi:MAG: AAA family ATPase [Bacillota bacterium]